jgi:uncharacterized DUF497 family protein
LKWDAAKNERNLIKHRVRFEAQRSWPSTIPMP